jgi:uncharacterized protein (UPF0335 family)
MQREQALVEEKLERLIQEIDAVEEENKNLCEDINKKDDIIK